MDKITYEIFEIFDPQRPWGALTLGVLALIGAIFLAKLMRIWTRKLANRSGALIDPTAISFFGQLAQVICFLLAILIYAHLVPALKQLGETMLASAGLVSLVIGLAA